MMHHVTFAVTFSATTTTTEKKSKTFLRRKTSRASWEAEAEGEKDGHAKCVYILLEFRIFTSILWIQCSMTGFVLQSSSSISQIASINRNWTRERGFLCVPISWIPHHRLRCAYSIERYINRYTPKWWWSRVSFSLFQTSN